MSIVSMYVANNLNAPADNTTTRFLSVIDLHESVFGTTEYKRAINVLPENTIAGRTKFLINESPGIGASWKFTLQKNSANTGSVVTISGNDTAGTDDSHEIHYLQGDLINYEVEPSGNPATFSQCHYGILFSASNAIIINNTGYSSSFPTATHFPECIGRSFNNTTFGGGEDLAGNLCPVNGDIFNFHIQINRSSGSTETFTFRKNSVDFGPEFAFTGANLILTDTTNIFAVSTGDKLNWRNPLQLGSFVQFAWMSFSYAPATPGVFPVIGGHSTISAAQGEDYWGWLLQPHATTSVNSGDFQNLTYPMTIDNFYVNTESTDVGTAGMIDFKIAKNNSASAFSIRIASDLNANSDLTNSLDFAEGDSLMLYKDLSGIIDNIQTVSLAYVASYNGVRFPSGFGDWLVMF